MKVTLKIKFNSWGVIDIPLIQKALESHFNTTSRLGNADVVKNPKLDSNLIEFLIEFKQLQNLENDICSIVHNLLWREVAVDFTRCVLNHDELLVSAYFLISRGVKFES